MKGSAATGLELKFDGFSCFQRNGLSRNLGTSIERWIIVVDFNLILSLGQEVRWNGYFSSFLIGHTAHKPVAATATGLYDIFTRDTIEGDALIEHRGAVFPELQFSLSLVYKRIVLPEIEL